MATTYVVTLRSHNDDRPSKFIVVADNMKSAINMAWEHGGPDFQSRFDKATGQAQKMKEGGCGFCEIWKISGSIFLILLVAALLWFVVKSFYY